MTALDFTLTPAFSNAGDGPVVTGDHFGTNFLFHNEGAKWAVEDSFHLAAEMTDVTTLRYPGGTITEQYFDIANPNQPYGDDNYGTATGTQLSRSTSFSNIVMTTDTTPSL